MGRTALVLAAVLATVAMAACGDDDDGGTGDNGGSGAPNPTGPTNPTVAAQDLETTEITFDNGEEEVELTVQIADQGAERAVGLMWLDSMPEDEGMVFSWPSEIPELAFYMRNTYIPLSIAFVRADGTIVNIEDMQPLSEELHRSAGPAMYAVEANQGWFEENDIEPGDRVIDIDATVPIGS